MDYSTFYWRHAAQFLNFTPQTGAAQNKIIEANSLYQNLGENGIIYLREVFFAAFTLDLSGSIAAPTHATLAILENSGYIRSSRNLNMTVIVAGDLNAPGGAFLMVGNQRRWYGKIKLPQAMEFNPCGGVQIAFAAGDRTDFLVQIGYELIIEN